MRSVLITGASTGIGEACAIYLAKHEWRVFAGVRKQADAKRLARAAPGIFSIVLDVTKSRQIARAVKTVRKQVGKDGLQGLVNNAGIAIAGPLEFLPIDELRLQMEVNFIGQVEVTQAFLPLLRAGGGRVVNISSVSGRVATPLILPYTASKFALEAFTDALRRELLPWKLHVVSVQPGAIATPIWKKSLKRGDTLQARLPRQAEALYGPLMERVRRVTKRSGANGIPAEKVARVVLNALTEPRPRTRYIVGRGTRFSIGLARWLPDQWMDWVITRVLYR